jgi:hypothetical protein
MSSETHDAIVREIRQEKAGALAQAVEALEEALAALRALDGAATPARAEALAVAGERLWYVVIQREAMGLVRHDTLFDVLGVPSAVRRVMGPRARSGAGGPRARPGAGRPWRR